MPQRTPEAFAHTRSIPELPLESSPPDTGASPKAAIILALASLLTLVAAQYLRWLPWDFDDAMIVYRMVRNLRAGDGWSYNPGELHNPSTSVLNPLVIAAFSQITESIPAAAHLASACAVAGCGVLSFLLLQQSSLWWRIVSAHLVVFSLAANSTWGLEVHLFSLGMLLLLNLRDHRWLPWLLIGILTLVRPDALLLVPLQAVVTWRRGERFSWRWLLLVIVPLVPWCWYSLATFGQVFPNTLANKIWQGRSGFWGHGYIYLRGWKDHLLSAPLLLPVTYLIGTAGGVRAFREQSPLVLLIAYCILHEGAYVLLNVPGYHWYYASADLCALLCALYELPTLARRINQHPPAFLEKRGALFVGSFLLFISAYTLWDATQRPRFDIRNESYKKATAMIPAVAPHARSVAALEVGTPGFYAADKRMVDLVGLTSTNPEYLTGQHNDQFFRAPPDVVLLHNPVWHFERALTEDLRFQVLYPNAVPVSEAIMPMQILALRADAASIRMEDELAKVRASYAPMNRTSDTKSLPVDPEALCVIDQINGILTSAKPATASQTLSIRGWAVQRDTLSPDADPELALIDNGTNVPAFTMIMQRHSRPDVAEHLKNARFEQAGVEGRALLVNVPTGSYRIGIIQRAKSGSPSLCVTSSLLVVAAK